MGFPQFGTEGEQKETVWVQGRVENEGIDVV
jgi:hypothetical protein